MSQIKQIKQNPSVFKWKMVALYCLLYNCCLGCLASQARGQAGYVYEYAQPLGDLSPVHAILRAATPGAARGQVAVFTTSFYETKWKSWTAAPQAGQPQWENPEAPQSDPSRRYLPPQEAGQGGQSGPNGPSGRSVQSATSGQTAQGAVYWNVAEPRYQNSYSQQQGRQLLVQKSAQPPPQDDGFSEDIFNATPAPTAPPKVLVRTTEVTRGAEGPIFENTQFANALNSLIAQYNGNMNTVVSPISLQTILALVYLGAGGRTAQQLQAGLGLSPNKSLVAAQFRQLMAKSAATYTDPNRVQLQTANKIYFANDISINQQFAQDGVANFDIESQKISFGQPGAEAEINAWVARKTQQLIKNVIQPQSLDADTAAILINAISFRAKWAQEFSMDDTRDGLFHASGQVRVPAQMMSNEERYRYAELPRVGAQVVDLPFKDSDMSMLVVLPMERDGLARVEANMRNVDLRRLPEQMNVELVDLQLPRFRVEFELDMVEALKRLGIVDLFTEQAELAGVLRGRPTLSISKVQHKAYLEVNEAGVKAAAASFSKFVPLALPSNLKEFKADHPFMYAIRSPQAVYFIGHVVTV